ncbi:MAG: hypothetical protein WC450_07350 [Candidatus Omnitrophota bacterium]
MITSIIAKNLKGLNFEQPVSQKTIFVGPNGAGKTARTQALTLALLGYVPGSSKLNEDILVNYGSTDTLIVGFELAGTIFERAWMRDDKGNGVKEKFQLNKKPCKKDAFVQKLGECGAPKIFDLSLFMDLSDQKKIDFLLSLYPVEANISELESTIETNKKNILALEDKARSTEKAAAALVASKATMKLPAGSLAETTAAIEKTEVDLETALDTLGDIVSANAAEKAKADAEAKAEADKKRAQEKADADKKKAEQAAEIAKTAAVNAVKKESMDKISNLEAEVKKANDWFGEKKEVLQKECVEEAGSISEETWNKVGTNITAILQSILDVIDASGCQVCAAKMAIRKEMKKNGR